MGTWLADLTNWVNTKWNEFTTWLRTAFEVLFQFWTDLYLDYTAFFFDLLYQAFLAGLEYALKVGVLVFERLPVPEFLTETSIGALLGSAGPWVAWMGGNMKLGECSALLAAAFAFRVTRKVLTLGQY